MTTKIRINAELYATYSKVITVTDKELKQLKKEIKCRDFDTACDSLDSSFKGSDNNDVYWSDVEIEVIDDADL
jgi:hypothetical protein